MLAEALGCTIDLSDAPFSIQKSPSAQLSDLDTNTESLKEKGRIGTTLDVERIAVDVDGKRLSSFDPRAADNSPRKNWTEPTRDLKRPTHGYIGLQNHDPGDVVWFQEVSVRPLARTK